MVRLISKFILVAALVWPLVGCDDSGIAGVEGTVTMDGEPLEGASVIFIPVAGGRPAGARTDAEGKYVLNYSGGKKGTIPGENKVQISTQADPEEGSPAKPETVPAKYNVASELSFTVEEGKKNIANFELDSQGPIGNQSGY